MEFSGRSPARTTSVPPSMQEHLVLGLSAFTYADFFEPHRLRELFAVFDEYVADRNPALYYRVPTL